MATSSSSGCRYFSPASSAVRRVCTFNWAKGPPNVVVVVCAGTGACSFICWHLERRWRSQPTITREATTKIGSLPFTPLFDWLFAVVRYPISVLSCWRQCANERDENSRGKSTSHVSTGSTTSCFSSCSELYSTIFEVPVRAERKSSVPVWGDIRGDV